MFERFTDDARQSVIQAQKEARLLRHDFVGAEHLLLGVAAAEEGRGRAALESLGVTAAVLRDRVASLLGEGDDGDTGANIPFTVAAKQALEGALREALVLGDHFLDSGHLLLSLLDTRQGDAAAVLAAAGVERDALREAVAGGGVPSAPRVRRVAPGGFTPTGLTPELEARLDEITDLLREILTRLERHGL
ncbi:MAG: Clp protease N-terminal domain-containing protein [Mycobacteriales bacterium]